MSRSVLGGLNRPPVRPWTAQETKPATVNVDPEKFKLAIEEAPAEMKPQQLGVDERNDLDLVRRSC